MGEMVEGQCKLCQGDGPLKNSHVAGPAWAHAATMTKTGSRHPLLVADGVARLKSEPLREYLLCERCEQRFGARENYIKRIAYDSDTSAPIQATFRNRIGSLVEVPDLDVDAVKYLAVSVAWRAHVCTKLPRISLAAYAEPCRQYLLGGPFPTSVYVRLAFLEFKPNERRPRFAIGRTIVDPQPNEDGVMPLIYFAYGGLVFWVGFGALASAELQALCLHRVQPPRVRILDPYAPGGFIEEGTRALRTAEPKGGAIKVLGRKRRL